MKLLVISNCYRIINTMKYKRLPVNMSFVLNHNFKKLAPVVKDLEKSRQKILENYMVKDEDGKPIITNNQYDLTDRTAFEKEIDELFNTEISIDFDKISKMEILRCDEEQFDSLTLEETSLLQDFMIEEPETINQ